MKNQDSLAAIIFHIIVSLLVWTKFEFTAACFYGATALLGTFSVHLIIYKGLFVRFWPLDYFNNNTSMTRLVTEPVMASCNIILSSIFLWAAFFFNLVGKAFKKYEGVMHSGDMNTYESLRHVIPEMGAPEANDSLSKGLFYIAEQFSSVLNISVVSFTIMSVITMLLIELTIYILWLKIKNKNIRKHIFIWE